jgi:hypothetical protein
MIRTRLLVRHRAPANIGVRQKEWSIIRVMLRKKPRGAGYTSASGLSSLIAVPGGGINVTFTSLGDIDAENRGWGYTWTIRLENLLW